MKSTKKVIITVLLAIMLVMGVFSENTFAASAPAAPSLQSAVSKSYSSVKVTWKEVSNADGYYVYRKTSGTSWKFIKEIKSGSTVSYTDTGLTCGTTYTYTVKAYRVVKEKKVFGSYSKKGIACKPVPAAPSLKSAVSKAYDSIKLTWGKVSGASGYYIYRKTSGTSWKLIKEVKSGSTVSYTDTGLTCGTTYIYTVKAYRTVNGRKIAGGYDTSGVSGIPRLSKASVTLTKASDTRVLIEWGECSDVDGYQVWRSTTESSGFTMVASTTELEYLDTSLTKGMTYYYRIRTYKDLDGSTVARWSNIENISLPAMYDSGIITPLEGGTNIYIAGDSTTRNYGSNGVYQSGKISSHSSWGEFLQDFFDTEIIQINDYGISSRSSRSFINEGRLDTISNSIQPGDYLFIQFGHNDTHSTSIEQYTMLGDPDRNGIYPVIPGEETETPSDLKSLYGETWYAQDTGTYKWYLYQYVNTALKADAIPVLVTPVSRLFYQSDGTIRAHHDSTDVDASERKDAYVTAMKQVYEEFKARRVEIYLIDMFSATKQLYENAYAADPDAEGTTSPLAEQMFDTDDTTHSSKMGGFIQAAQMALEIQESDMGISSQVRKPKNVTALASDKTTVAVTVNHQSTFTGYVLNLTDGNYSVAKSSYWTTIGRNLISQMNQ